MEDINKIKAEYETLKQHRKILEEMITEADSKVDEFIRHANENEGKPFTVRNCLAAAKRWQKRLDALKASLVLADNELSHYLQLLK